MFGKNKKNSKNDNIDESKSSQIKEDSQEIEEVSNDKFTPELPPEEENELSGVQKEKLNKLDSVKDKISKILQSSNIEIVDENFGDEYESGTSSGNDKQQQDYDSLKSLFSAKDKTKKQELTLTIDDFDYTYVGQYIDEYDLMHMKGIKKVKLRKKHSKHLKKILIAASLVFIIGVGGFLGYFFTKKEPVVLTSVTLSNNSRSYYVGEKFDYTEIYIIKKYSNGSQVIIPLEHKYFAGYEGGALVKEGIQFNGLTPKVELRYNCDGYIVKYNVQVLDKKIKGIRASYANGLFKINASLSQPKYINEDLLMLFVDYDEYGVENLKLSNDGIKINVDGNDLTYIENKGFKVTKNITKESTISISYNGKTLNLVFDENSLIVK